MSGLTFPIPVKGVPKFEKQNLFVSVHVLCCGDGGGYIPLYVSKERNRFHHVNLFVIEGPDDHHHYVWIKNMSRLVFHETNHQHQTIRVRFVPSSTLERHVPNCQRHPSQDVRYPDRYTPRNVQEHNVCGFACHRVSDYPEYQTDSVVYSGPQVMDKFYEHIMIESQVISAILADDRDMHPALTDTQPVKMMENY